MEVDEVIHEGRVCGIDFWDILNWTWGEVQEYVSCFYERERNLYKNLSTIAARQSILTCRLISSGGTVEIAEEFPFWTDEERKEMKLQRLKRSLMR